MPNLLSLLSDEEPAVRRAAATAVGRIKAAEAVPALLAGLRAENDRFLDHALIYALIEIADRTATRHGLTDSSPHVRRGALVALNQMDGGLLTRDEVVPLVGHVRRSLAQGGCFPSLRHDRNGPEMSPGCSGNGRDAASWTRPVGKVCATRCWPFAATAEIQHLVANGPCESKARPPRRG